MLANTSHITALWRIEAIDFPTSSNILQEYSSMDLFQELAIG